MEELSRGLAAFEDEPSSRCAGDEAGRAGHRLVRPGPGAGRRRTRSRRRCSTLDHVGRRRGAVAGARRLPVERAGQRPHRRRQRPWSWPRDGGRRHVGRVAAAGGGGGRRHAGPPGHLARPGRRRCDLRARGPARRRRQDLPSAAAGAARGEDPGDGRLAHAGARKADGLAARAAVAAGRPADRREDAARGRPSRHPPALQPEEPSHCLPACRLALSRARRRPTWRAPSPRCTPRAPSSPTSITAASWSAPMRGCG